MRGVLALAGLELTRLLRLRMSFTLLLLVPALQVLLFGTAIRHDATGVTLAVGAAEGPATDALLARLDEVAGLIRVGDRLVPRGASALVSDGRALVGIDLPEDPAAPVRLTADGTDPTLVAVALARLESFVWPGATPADLSPTTLSAPHPRAVETVRLYNPEGRSDWVFLPALVGVTVMISRIMLGSLSLAREREGGQWEALLALAVSPAAILAGKLLPGIVIGTLQGASVLAVGIWLFDLPAKGPLWALLLLLPPYAAVHLALGFLISGRAATQLAALQGAVAVYLPAMLLSGFLYPFTTLPGWAQAIGSVFPLTHLIRVAEAAAFREQSAAETLMLGGPIGLALVVIVAIALLSPPRRLA